MVNNNRVLRIKARQVDWDTEGLGEWERERVRETDMRLDNVVRYPCNVAASQDAVSWEPVLTGL